MFLTFHKQPKLKCTSLDESGIQHSLSDISINVLSNQIS